jgi:hypothetical protein
MATGFDELLDPVVSSYEHGNKYSGSVKVRGVS